MQGVVNFLQNAGLHPVVDHFTVSLIVIGILADLVASLLPSRLWIRSMATSLMVLGAIAAVASKFTGGWAADIVHAHGISGEAQALLHRHAVIGDYLAWTFIVLALWRLGLHFVNFFARTRNIYLILAVLAGGAILYQGDLGGDLVYDYGVGTAPELNAAASVQATPAPESAASATAVPTAIPTVFVPPSPSMEQQVTPSALPTPTMTATTLPSSSPPTSSPGTPINPPPGPGGSAPASPQSTSRML
jgi:uncharacterized membrane protein